MDGAILCAAVADFRPVETSDTKFETQRRPSDARSETTTDIAAELGKIKTRTVLVGFALETE